MTRKLRLFSFALLALISLACNLISVKIDPAPAPAPSAAPPESPATPLPPAAAPADNQPPAVLDPCALVTQAEAEAILAEPATAPKVMGGGCTFTNAKDSLYALTVAAAQGKDIDGILQGQAMLLGFAGAPMDETRLAGLRSLADAQDYKGFFAEMVSTAGGSPIIKARLVDDKTSDLVYWAWIDAKPRLQGAYIALRGPTMVNINLVVSEAQTEEAMLSAASSLAAKVFERLPARFTLPAATATPAPTATPAASETPTLIPSPTFVQ